MGNAEQTEMQHVLERIDHLEKEAAVNENSGDL